MQLERGESAGVLGISPWIERRLGTKKIDISPLLTSGVPLISLPQWVSHFLFTVVCFYLNWDFASLLLGNLIHCHCAFFF